MENLNFLKGERKGEGRKRKEDIEREKVKEKGGEKGE